MKKTEKEQIKKRLEAFCQHIGSQNKVANIIGVSPAIVSQVITGKWNLIADEMWEKVGVECDGYSDNGTEDWAIAETKDFLIMTAALQDAQDNHDVAPIIGAPGWGKTQAIKSYVSANKNAFRLFCGAHWTRKMFVEKLLQAMGVEAYEAPLGVVVEDAVRRLKRIKNPLIIMDEIDKLNDGVLYLFITLYNELNEGCGFYMSATPYFKKKIERGVKSNLKGYREIYSRMRGKFIELEGVGSRDIKKICLANGVTDKDLIREVVEDSEWDLRRVRRKIHLIKKTSNG